MDLQEIRDNLFKYAEKLPKIIAAVLSEKNKERVEAIKKEIEEQAESLEEYGVDLYQSLEECVRITMAIIADVKDASRGVKEAEIIAEVLRRVE